MICLIGTVTPPLFSIWSLAPPGIFQNIRNSKLWKTIQLKRWYESNVSWNSNHYLTLIVFSLYSPDRGEKHLSIEKHEKMSSMWCNLYLGYFTFIHICDTINPLNILYWISLAFLKKGSFKFNDFLLYYILLFMHTTSYLTIRPVMLVFN